MEWKVALWAGFFRAAPQQQRRSADRSNPVCDPMHVFRQFRAARSGSLAIDPAFALECNSHLTREVAGCGPTSQSCPARRELPTPILDGEDAILAKLHGLGMEYEGTRYGRRMVQTAAISGRIERNRGGFTPPGFDAG